MAILIPVARGGSTPPPTRVSTPSQSVQELAYSGFAERNASLSVDGKQVWTMQNSLIDCVEPFKNAKADAKKGRSLSLDVEAWFLAQQGNLAAAADLNGYMPNGSSAALTGGSADLSHLDARLEDADYIGAFDGRRVI
ncbi:hypothetical protein [Shewanella benthica]|uniref:hypothetical protein n=1 Tax=Shewanella benthica TaxID=43661 RepID=UPI0018D50E1D|nr:hypothetical protein [Shewanella benthica]